MADSVSRGATLTPTLSLQGRGGPSRRRDGGSSSTLPKQARLVGRLGGLARRELRRPTAVQVVTGPHSRWEGDDGDDKIDRGVPGGRSGRGPCRGSGGRRPPGRRRRGGARPGQQRVHVRPVRAAPRPRRQPLLLLLQHLQRPGHDLRRRPRPDGRADGQGAPLPARAGPPPPRLRPGHPRGERRRRRPSRRAARRQRALAAGGLPRRCRLRGDRPEPLPGRSSSHWTSVERPRPRARGSTPGSSSRRRTGSRISSRKARSRRTRASS